MNCDKAEFLLAMYVSGDLEPAERDEVNAHVSGCPACLEKLNLFRKDRERVSTLASEAELCDAGPDFMDGVLEKIAAEDARKPSYFTAWHALTAVAAVVLIACLVIFFGLSGGAPDGGANMLSPSPAAEIDNSYIRPVDANERHIDIIIPNRFERVRPPEEKRERTIEF